MELIDNNTLGNFKANSSIGEVEIFIKWGFIKIYKDSTALMFYINDEKAFQERDNDILLVADKENQKGIVVYKPLEKVEIDPYERQDFTGWKQVRKFVPDINKEIKSMKIKYDKPKGQRINRYFMGMSCKNKDGETYWYYDKEDKWCTDSEDVGQYNGMCGNYNNSIRTLRTATRKIKKYAKYLPKGTIFKLSNKYSGYDIEITI